MNCCTQRGLNQIFTSRIAQDEIKHYRKHGLEKRDRILAELVAARGVQGASLLEIGGGIGGIQLALLRAGAARSVDVDISEGYVVGARELAGALGFGAVSEQRVLDFAQQSAEVAPADVVIMNRVVCCYPDMPALVQPAARHAQRLLALTFPREGWWMHLGRQTINLGMQLLHRDFRFFVHSHAAIIALVEANGLRVSADRFSGVWRMMLFERG